MLQSNGLCFGCGGNSSTLPDETLSSGRQAVHASATEPCLTGSPCKDNAEKMERLARKAAAPQRGMCPFETTVLNTLRYLRRLSGREREREKGVSHGRRVAMGERRHRRRAKRGNPGTGAENTDRCEPWGLAFCLGCGPCIPQASKQASKHGPRV